MESKHKGACSEMAACSFLLREGYEVYRNVSAHGMIDIIAIRGKETLYVDVKSAKVGELLGGPIYSRITKQQRDNGVILIVVYDNGECFVDSNPRVAGECYCACGSIVTNGNRKYCSPKCQGDADDARIQERKTRWENDYWSKFPKFCA